MANALLLNIAKNFVDSSYSMHVENIIIPERNRGANTDKTVIFDAAITFKEPMQFMYYATAGYEGITEETVVSSRVIYPPTFILLSPTDVAYTVIGVRNATNGSWRRDIVVNTNQIQPKYIVNSSVGYDANCSYKTILLVGKFI